MAEVQVQNWPEHWTKSIESLFNLLERPDQKQIADHNSWEHLDRLVSQVTSNPVTDTHRDLQSLELPLATLKRFHQVWIRRALGTPDTTAFRGIVWRALELIGAKNSPTKPVVRYFEELFRQIEPFDSHSDESQEINNRPKESCIEAGCAVAGCCKQYIDFVRTNPRPTAFGSKTSLQWNHVADEFSRAQASVNRFLSHVKESSKPPLKPRRPSDVDRRARQSPHFTARQDSFGVETAELPCLLPPPTVTHVSGIYDRVDIINDIADHFKAGFDKQPLQALVIHGLGGVGKSTVAQEYAARKWRERTAQGVFWILSENTASIRQCFSKAAVLLRLPGAADKDDEQNRLILLNWLARTTCSWLMVFDNAESAEVLQAYWPIAGPLGHGQALVTTRNPNLAFDLSAKAIEVTTWSPQEGSEFLLRLLENHIGAELQQANSASALELSERLSGHALAIAQMAGLIHQRSCSIEKFLRIYSQHPSKMHGTSANKSINTLWDLSFQSLDEQSATILGVLCYLDPDGIPETLFRPADVAQLPDRLAFCEDEFIFENAIGNLLTLALIKRDGDSETLSLHRLVQSSFKNFLTPEQRQQSFAAATALVSMAFPRQDAKSATMFTKWKDCATYLQQVLRLKDCFVEERRLNRHMRATYAYCDLSNACQRYLIENSAYADLRSLIDVNFEAFATLTESEKIVALENPLTSHRGQLLCRLNRAKEGVTWVIKSYQLRKDEVPLNHMACAWPAGNTAEAYMSLGDHKNALVWVERAYEHWTQWTSLAGLAEGDWPANAKNSLATILSWAGDLTSAKRMLHEVASQMKHSSSPSWAASAYNHFSLGRLDHLDRAYESAESHYFDAQNAWTKGDQMRTAPFNAACMYRMGCVSLDQGKTEAAVKHFRDALTVTETRKDVLVGEHARVIFKLSEALEQDQPGSTEAIELRELAEELLRKRLPGQVDTGREATYDALVCVYWR